MWVTSFGNGMKMGFLYPAGTDEINKDNGQIMVYPNPANEKIVIETNGISAKNTLYIINIHGQEILTQQTEGFKTEVKIRNLLCGVYFIKIYSDKGSFIAKFVKE
jgi:hypothetical protein